MVPGETRKELNQQTVDVAVNDATQTKFRTNQKKQKNNFFHGTLSLFLRRVLRSDWDSYLVPFSVTNRLQLLHFLTVVVHRSFSRSGKILGRLDLQLSGS